VGLKLGFTRFTSENKNFDRDNDDKQVDEDVFFPLDFSTHPELGCLLSVPLLCIIGLKSAEMMYIYMYIHKCIFPFSHDFSTSFCVIMFMFNFLGIVLKDC
jgi:hypothetical protein